MSAEGRRRRFDEQSNWRDSRKDNDPKINFKLSEVTRHPTRFIEDKIGQQIVKVITKALTGGSL